MRRILTLGPKSGLRHLLPILFAAILLPVLWRRLSDLEPDILRQTLSQVAVWEWVAALIATGFSFAAVGQYDAVMHRALGTGISAGRARWAGVRAIALSQTLGLSALTGALVRWRVLPDLDLMQATRLSVFVGLSFLGAWAIVTLGVVTLVGQGAYLPAWLPFAALSVLAACALAAGFRHLAPKGWAPPLSPWDAIAMIGWALLDTGFAALALWLFLPDALQPAFGPFFAAYLLALGAGLVSNTPGGIGAFELTLLMVLPKFPEAELLAAVMAFRVVYYVIPAVLALIGIAKVTPAPERAKFVPAAPQKCAEILRRTDRPDWGLVRQHGLLLTDHTGHSGWFCGTFGPALVAIGGPKGHMTCTDLSHCAADMGRLPLLYKLPAALAATARRAGWAVWRTAAEAVIDPATWTPLGSSRRQLRRKLRHATDQGVSALAINYVDLTAKDAAQMDLIAADWAKTSGGERGFSMGRYDPSDLTHQRIFLARQGDQMLGFVTFRAAGGVWILDLVRHRADIPDGTMHLLIAAALGQARTEGARRLTLAAVPAIAGALARLNKNGAGLAQFKQSFGPKWEPLYAAAPGPVTLVIGMALVTAAIHRPPVLGHRNRDQKTGLLAPKPAN